MLLGDPTLLDILPNSISSVESRIRIMHAKIAADERYLGTLEEMLDIYELRGEESNFLQQSRTRYQQGLVQKRGELAALEDRLRTLTDALQQLQAAP
jgi:predicted  nucleic acid-binding Zn-ribbon protein